MGSGSRPEDSFFRYKHAETALFHIEIHIQHAGGFKAVGMTDEKKARINDLYRRKFLCFSTFLQQPRH